MFSAACVSNVTPLVVHCGFGVRALELISLEISLRKGNHDLVPSKDIPRVVGGLGR